ESREHFLELKRLGDIIIAASIQPLDLVLPAPSRGQYQNRKTFALLANGADHGQAIHLRQAEINDSQVVIVFGGEVDRLASVSRAVDGIAVLLQLLSQGFAQGLFVFYQQ